MYMVRKSCTLIVMDIVALYGSGLSLDKIADQTGITRHTVRKRLHEAGVEIKQRGGRTQERTHKRCPRCGETKPVEAFDRRRYPSGTWGLHGYCRPCNVENSRMWTYGLTQEQYDEMLDEQDGKCAICRRPPDTSAKQERHRKLHIDHDHKTNRVRQLLCFFCNWGLGCFDDDLDRMAAAMNYVARHREAGQ